MPSILIINPNSSASITENLKDILEPPSDFLFSFFTGPSPERRKSEETIAHLEEYTINDHDDGRADHATTTKNANSNLSVAALDSASKYAPIISAPIGLYAPPQIDSYSTSVMSAAACLPFVKPIIKDHDAFLVACFSDHPLVGMLREVVPAHKPVMGIFNASVLTSLSLGTRFAIVTTAKVWERLLDDAVLSMLGSTFHYAGTFSTGLGVLEIHELPPTEVTNRLVGCAREAVAKGATSIILGCAGLSGLDEAIREAVGKHIPVIDSVVAGTEMLTGLVRSRSALFGDD